MRVKDRTPFGERLYGARIRARLSQGELASRAGMAQSTVAQLEKSGQGSAKTSQLAKVLGVDVNWLADGSGVPTVEEVSSVLMVREKVAPYLVPGAGTDYRTLVHTFADALDSSGVSVTVRQFVTMVDETYKKLPRH